MLSWTRFDKNRGISGFESRKSKRPKGPLQFYGLWFFEVNEKETSRMQSIDLILLESKVQALIDLEDLNPKRRSPASSGLFSKIGMCLYCKSVF